MKPTRPLTSARRLAARLGITLAALAFVAAATGGAGLAHRLVAHADAGANAHPSQPDGCSADPHHGYAHHHTPDEAPSDAPAEAPHPGSESHDCDVCLLLAAGVTPPPAPPALPALAPATPQAPPTASTPPARAPRLLPPSRGPPSSSA